MSMRGKSSGKMPPSRGMNAAGQRPAYPQEIDISHIGRRLRAERRRVRNDTLKWILSEVLHDLRQQGKCYVKYEVKQGCFHITAR